MTLNPTGESHRRWLSFVQRLAHGFHGPRDGPDIAGPAGFDQNKSQSREKIRVDVGRVHLNGELSGIDKQGMANAPQARILTRRLPGGLTRGRAEPHLFTYPPQERRAARIGLERQHRQQAVFGAVAHKAERRDQAPAVDLLLRHEDRTDGDTKPGAGRLQGQIEMLVGLAARVGGRGFGDGTPAGPGVLARGRMQDSLRRQMQLLAL